MFLNSRTVLFYHRSDRKTKFHF